MPISIPDKPNEPSAVALASNRRGIALRSQGRFAEAVAAFREGVAAQPGLSELHVNLAFALADCGQMDEAIAEYRTAIELDPQTVAARIGLGSLLVRLGRFEEARATYASALDLDARNMQANLAMYELEQIAGNTERAIAHQQRVLERQTLFSERAPQERRSILVLLAPGDWQANVPIDFLIDRATTTVHKFYITSPDAVDAALPAVDVVFTAIAESDENTPRLALAQRIVDRLGLPAINPPRNILRTNRVEAAKVLAAIPTVAIPHTRRLAREALRRRSDLDFPIVIRPVGSQAGKDLERVTDSAHLRAYVDRVQAPAFFVMPFVDFSRPDGYYRKYRIIVVDGTPYPYHLAISPNWIIHYYNAPMSEHAWMREEEARFLNDFDSVFPEQLQNGLRDIARALDLEYFGVDCSIDRDGRLLVFEADPAMIVHAGDDPAMFGYKIPAAQRVFAAFERLVDRARSR